MQRGYMATKHDFRNFEMSGEFKCGGGSGDHLQLYGRGGFQKSGASSTSCIGCTGSRVALNIDLNNNRVAHWYEVAVGNRNYTPTVDIPAEVVAGWGGGPIKGKWHRHLWAVYNIENDTKVVSEFYIAVGLTNDFRLIQKVVYRGVKIVSGLDSTKTKSYSGAKACGNKDDDQPITWGGPVTSWKWDHMGDGNAVSFRKLSIREIDVTKTGTGGGSGGGTGGDPNPPPPDTSGTLSRKFRDIFNINSSAAQSCSGLQGGVLPFEIVYDEHAGTTTKNITDDPAFQNRTRVCERVMVGTSASRLFGKKPRMVLIPMKKAGSPGGDVTCAIWDDAADPLGGNKVVELGTLHVNTLDTSFKEVTFYNEAAPLALPVGMKKNYSIGVEYLGTSATDNIVVERNDADPIDGANSMYMSMEKDQVDPNHPAKLVTISKADVTMKVYT
jgi:hypothetical protein